MQEAINGLLAVAKNLKNPSASLNTAFTSQFESLAQRVSDSIDKARQSIRGELYKADSFAIQRYFLPIGDKVFMRSDWRIESALPKTYDLYQRLRSNESATSPLLDEVIQELSSRTASEALKMIFDKQIEQSKQGLEESLKALEEKLSKSKDEVTVWTQARDAATKSLQDLEVRQQQAVIKKGELDQKLVLAIYFMIGSIPLLFTALRIFPEKLAESIVTERTMIELLSMGFLLLTVIILATGEQLAKEAVGTLLGTIAGYIFGRKINEPGTVPREQKAPRQEPPAKEQKTSPQEPPAK